MPLMKYFGFVGSALVLLLLVMNWVLPEPTTEPIHGSIERPSIRISSIESLPERVVFDTSMRISHRHRLLHELLYSLHNRHSHLHR